MLVIGYPEICNSSEVARKAFKCSRLHENSSMNKRNSLASGFIDSALVKVRVTELTIIHGIEVTC